MIYLASTCVSFLAVFLKGFQHKNVIGDHYRLAFFTSYAMAMFEVASIALVVKGGWVMAFTTGTGAAFGIVCAMYAHNRLHKKQTK